MTFVIISALLGALSLLSAGYSLFYASGWDAYILVLLSAGLFCIAWFEGRNLESKR